MAYTNIEEEGYEPSTITIYGKSGEILLQEPSLIAYNSKTFLIKGLGEEAKQWIESTEEDIHVICPLRNGFIADYIAAQKMFEQFLKKAQCYKCFFRPRLIICIPPKTTEVEKKAYQDAFFQSRCKEVSLAELPVETAIQNLSSRYSLFVEITPNQDNNQKKESRVEKWKEVFQDEILPGDYEARLIDGRETGLLIELINTKTTILIHFKNALAVRILEENLALRKLYPNEKFFTDRKNKFQNVIYQIEGGEFAHFINELYKNRFSNLRHYIIQTKNLSVEIIAEKEPDIKI